MVQAYGTAFTVSCYGKDSCTTLLRSHVTITIDEQTKTLWEEEQVQTTEGKQDYKVTIQNKRRRTRSLFYGVIIIMIFYSARYTGTNPIMVLSATKYNTILSYQPGLVPKQ